MTAIYTTADAYTPSQVWAAFFAEAENTDRAKASVWKPAKWNTFSIPKADGGQRDICAPDEWAKKRGAILAEFIAKKWQPRYEAGFLPKTGAPTVVDTLRQARDDGYTIVAVDMSKAFARVTAAQVFRAVKHLTGDTPLARMAWRLSTKDRKLVMGAPASPLLFSMVMEPALRKVEGLDWVHDIICYADDTYLVVKSLPRQWKRTLKRILYREAGQKLNGRKTRVFRPESRMQALGVSIEPDGEIRATRAPLEAKARAAEAKAQKGQMWEGKSGKCDAASVAKGLRTSQRLWYCPHIEGWLPTSVKAKTKAGWVPSPQWTRIPDIFRPDW